MDIHTKFVYKLDISNHKTVLNEKYLITFSTSFKSLLDLNQNFQHKLSRVIQFKTKKFNKSILNKSSIELKGKPGQS